MGSNEYDVEKPPHQVTVQEFYLGKFPVTQEQWQVVMGKNPSNFSDNPQNPVEHVSWHDCQEFCQKLSQITGKIYRLPSEAEWEYACRAGTQTRYYFGDNENELGDYAWYGDNSGDSILNTIEIWKNNQEGYFDRLMNNKNKTHPVGKKKLNSWGLYDMYGNVWEWCEDSWHSNYQKAPTDGSPWNDNDSQNRVIRSGSWSDNPGYCRSAFRFHLTPDDRYSDVGFRVVCVRPRLS